MRDPVCHSSPYDYASGGSAQWWARIEAMQPVSDDFFLFNFVMAPDHSDEPEKNALLSALYVAYCVGVLYKPNP